jgi:hypothetical protein
VKVPFKGRGSMTSANINLSLLCETYEIKLIHAENNNLIGTSNIAIENSILFYCLLSMIE